MKKTKREKLLANLRRQKELERIRTLTNEVSFKDDKKEEGLEELALTKPSPKHQEEISSLTNLSYLPSQLIKIGWVSLGLIAIQILVYLLIL